LEHACMKNPKRYMDIGHRDPNDLLWIMLGFDFNQVTAAGTWTHEMLWGKQIGRYWRGRYERKTGYCSILPPETESSAFKRPPAALLDKLMQEFSVTKFYFFSGGLEEFTPNPRR